jgi:phospholipid/cholesterol/gamma-HCH transport system substrate-binding protein
VRTAIRKHLRDFLAIMLLGVVAIGVAAFILSNQRFYLPAWVPLIGTDFYTVEAELPTAQAVVPGQGQTINIAGVKVGDIGKVRLERGRAVVEMKIQRKYAPIYRDATVLLRPKTGLKDMYLQLTPGTRGAGELPEKGRVPVSNSLPDVNLDEILAELDTDTRQYLKILLNAGGQALSDADPTEDRAGESAPGAATSIGTEPAQDVTADLRETFKRFEPTNRDLERITRLLAERRQNIARVIHNFQELSTELASRDSQLAALVDSSNANFQALARQDENLRESLRLLPGTLDQTEETFGDARALASALGSATSRLRPAARNLGPALRATRPFLRDSTPIIREELRPFTRQARPTVRQLRLAAQDLAAITPRLNRTFVFVNKLLNTLAYNPPGSEEGYLFWASWVNHAGASIFQTQDAHGAIRRGMFLTNCSGLGVLETIGAQNPQLQVLIDLLAAPTQEQVCAQGTPTTPAPTSASASRSKRKRGAR